MASTATPTGITPLRGVRSWRVDDHGFLSSPTARRSGPLSDDRFTWPTDRPMTARCQAGVMGPYLPGPHPVPSPDCSCGMYALRRDLVGRAVHPLSRVAEAVTVVGEVDLYGTVVEGTRGYRAEHARVVSLWRLWDDEHETAMTAVARRYAIPIVDVDGDTRARLRSRHFKDALAHMTFRMADDYRADRQRLGRTVRSYHHFAMSVVPQPSHFRITDAL